MRHTIKMFGLVSVLALSACDGEQGDDLVTFVGTWQATAGTATTICPGYAPFTDATVGNTVWSRGVSSDLLAATTALVRCPMMADVTGSTAAGVPGQTCTQSDGAGTTSTVAFAGYTFVVSPDNRTAREDASGQITYTADGAIVVCSFTATSSYQKIGN